MQGRQSPLIPDIDICPLGKEQFNHVPVVLQHGTVQRCTISALGGQTCAFVHKKLHHLAMPAPGRPVERRGIVDFHRCIDLGPVGDKEFGNVLMPRIGRVIQRCGGIFVKNIDIGTLGQQLAAACKSAYPAALRWFRSIPRAISLATRFTSPK